MRPFVKTVGGKTQLLPRLVELAPKDFVQYHEPFLGGGALFFALAPRYAWLGDANPRLVNVWRWVKDDPERLIASLRALASLSPSKERFLEVRGVINDELTGVDPLDRRGIMSRLDVGAAARYLYVNKLGFNGLWRVNSGGQCNVPYGGDRSCRFDEENIRACSETMRSSNALVAHEDFEMVRTHAREGDLVYFDPPYVPLKAESFVGYTNDGFAEKDHVRLRDLARELKGQGISVMVSNSDTPRTRDLYAGFTIHEVRARRSINSDGQGRGRVGELVIT